MWHAESLAHLDHLHSSSSPKDTFLLDHGLGGVGVTEEVLFVPLLPAAAQYSSRLTAAHSYSRAASSRSFPTPTRLLDCACFALIPLSAVSSIAAIDTSAAPPVLVTCYITTLPTPSSLPLPHRFILHLTLCPPPTLLSCC